MDASFRYPMDFSFYIQNFTTIAYNRVVKPKQQATLYYQFFVSESFAARSFGLTVNLLYRDADGIQYLNSVFNETINVVEIDEGLDGETFFLYVFLAACGVLLLVGAQQLLVNMGKKKSSAKPKVEMGTQNVNDVDYDWLPKETLNELNKSPRRSPRQSPRQRRVKRGTGSGDE
ncbi:translocon-associated protein subunit alpha-like [Limulus polyphemus]|uniref:Translocon-associated protein subunit alpha n=1 Tax=Limulus polyphemus TaxID=6850 RepID=A0ABM1B9S8_LIMPO|nr:translocon-associated protein subunit alpha-like [Limulus polyphemus]